MLKQILIFVVGAVVGVAAAAAWLHRSAASFNTPFQAVLLDTGQVYYGKLSGLGTDYPVLHEVFYIQSAADANTKQVTNVLIRRGKEWHGPDFTMLNARHIALIEPVSPSSKVAELIAEQEKQGK